MRSQIKRLVSFTLALTTALAATGAALAQTPAPASPASAAALPVQGSDKSLYYGDRVKYRYAKNVSRVALNAPGAAISNACLPAYTTLQGSGTRKRSDSQEPVPAFAVTSVGEKGCDKQEKVGEGDTVLIPLDDLQSMPPDRYGLTFGTLMVPYKYHLKGSKNFTASATVGPYMGYRQERSGWLALGLQYIVFAGATSVSISRTVDGKTETGNEAGISYGVGVLGSVKDNFNIGLVLGADRVGKSAGYADNGKAWIALQFGYAFSN